jgi:beta-lactamase regulating signal transducer with metallopeptidase domain
MSVGGGAMIAAILMLRALFRGRLPRRGYVLMWAMALIRLVLPFTIPSRLSAYSAAIRVEALPQVRAALPMPVRTLMRQALPGAVALPSPAPVQGSPAESVLPAVDWLLVVYLAGALLLSALFAVAYLRQFRVLRQASSVEDGYAAIWLRDQRLRRRVRLRTADALSSPLTYGLLRPVIVLPRALLGTDEARLQCVLTHELVHVRRLDAPLKLLAAAALCLHWFNPLAWVFYLLLNRDVELACDEAVVEALGGDHRAGYASLLIELQSEDRYAPLTSGFSHRAARERIISIMKYKKASALALALAAVLAIGVSAAFATSGESAKQLSRMVAVEQFYPEETAEPDAELLAVYDRVAAFMVEGYENLTVAEFRNRLAKAFPEPLPGDPYVALNYYDPSYEAQNPYPAPFSRAYCDLRPPEFEANILLPVPPGTIAFPRYPSVGWLDDESGSPATNAGIFYSIGWRTIDPGAITVGERERRINGYEAEFLGFLEGLSAAELAADGSLDKLRAKRDELAAKYSIPALSVRALNLEIQAQIDGKQYVSERVFLDNIEAPPVQAPVAADGVALKATDSALQISYGVDASGRGLVSPDQGLTWYVSDYRDQRNGLSHRFDAAQNRRFVSPDNGANWYRPFNLGYDTSGSFYYCADRKLLLSDEYGGFRWNITAFPLEPSGVSEEEAFRDPLLSGKP